MEALPSQGFMLQRLNEPQLRRFAEELAFCLRPGDAVTLTGDLGAGKTTFARALIRALTRDPEHEVPSPTFTIVQTYEADGLQLAHFDLYRLAAPEELEELGFDHLLATGAVLVEWPERAEGRLPVNRLDISLAEPPSSDDETRDIRLVGRGTWAARSERLIAMHRLIREAGYNADDVRLSALPGDASTRSYARLSSSESGPEGDVGLALVMDWPRQSDGPAILDGKPYSQIAKLAEDVRPFLAVARVLLQAGLSVPEIYGADTKNGFIVLEDLGPLGYAEALAAGADQRELWTLALEALLVLRSLPASEPLPVGNGETHLLPELDEIILGVETALVPDWLWPAVYVDAMPPQMLAAYRGIWSPIFADILSEPTGWMLRDFHSPNLIVCPGRQCARRTGIIDFQDALQGPAAYDLVSLLQDARLNVSESLERELLMTYCARAKANDASFDEDRFRWIYAALGAQRNTKILGIFARLARRDNKTRYLAHMPRIWGYLERNLVHPGLTPLARWYEEAFPKDLRRRPLEI
jgi:N-acetylmuramate 1-kinase